VPNGGGELPVLQELGIPFAEADVPGVPSEATSFGALLETTIDFFSGIFGFGGKSAPELAAERQFSEDLNANNNAIIANLRAGLPVSAAQHAQLGLIFTSADLEPFLAERRLVFAEQAISEITGRPSIPTPEEGGPPLVTERFKPLFPDAPEFEGEPDMPVDVPLLAQFGSLLPAVRGVVQPSIQGVVGGLAGGFLSEFLRPIQETGLGTVPMRQAVPQGVPGCPPEKPHTRILRFIKQNTGVSIKLTRAKALIRELGLENAARCLGINAMEACSLIIVASPRRRRGISASDVRIVKRTARRFESLKHDLSHIGGRAAPHHRRRHPRHVHK